MANDLNLQALESALVSAGHPRNATFHDQRPFVAVVNVPWGSTSRGRFFPSRNAVLIASGPDEDIATNHELAHAAVYCTACGGTGQSERTRCSYRGAHSPRFYRELARIHKANGVSVERAREFERSCGYAYPKGWDRKGAW